MKHSIAFFILVLSSLSTLAQSAAPGVGAGTATPVVDGTAAAGMSTLFSRQDHVHPTDTSRAPLASPAFTGNVSATGGITATSDGVHAGIDSLVGNTTNPSLPSNTFSILGPASASFTSYGVNAPSTAPAAGTVWCQNSITALTFCNQLNYSGIGTSITTDAWVLANTTPATSGAPQQNSPCLHWIGQAWNTGGTPASNQVDFRVCDIPASSGYTSGALIWYTTQNGGSFNPQYVMDSFGDFSAYNSIGTPRFQATGSTFSAAGCSNSTAVGASSAGSFHSGTSGTCTVTITMGSSENANNGWSCWANDLTTPADVIHQTAATNSATQVTLSGTTVSGDVVNFGCLAY